MNTDDIEESEVVTNPNDENIAVEMVNIANCKTLDDDEGELIEEDDDHDLSFIDTDVQHADSNMEYQQST